MLHTTRETGLRPGNLHRGGRARATVLDHRRHHAWLYLSRIRPVIQALTTLLLISALGDPERATLGAFAVQSAGILSVALSLMALRWFDPIRVVNVIILLELALLMYVITTLAGPEIRCLFLLWPIVAIGYFGSATYTLLAASACVVYIFLLAEYDTQWTYQGWLPPASYILLITAIFLSFVTKQSRKVENELIEEHERDHRALDLTRRIRILDTPAGAVEELAREIGEASETKYVAAFAFDGDEDYITDIYTWHRDESNSRFETTDFDSTVRRMLAGGISVAIEQTKIELMPLTYEDVDALDAEHLDTRSIETPLRELLEQANCNSLLLLPLLIGGRVVGAILMLDSAKSGWTSREFSVFEPVLPQIAAGLAQVLLLRDQKSTVAALERVDRIRDQLIANVSHELRTPLTSTIGFIETLLRPDMEFDKNAHDELLRFARDGAQRLVLLVEDLLTITNTRPDSLHLSPTPIRVHELFDEAVRQIDMENGISLTVRLDRDPEFIADRHRMLQVITNLLTNAQRYGNGRIELRCPEVEDESMIEFDVYDNGDGIPTEHEHEMFLPFARFTMRTDSTGLGLAICRTIVEAHHGTIDYARMPDMRTRFRVRIPRGIPAEA